MLHALAETVVTTLREGVTAAHLVWSVCEPSNPASLTLDQTGLIDAAALHEQAAGWALEGVRTEKEPQKL